MLQLSFFQVLHKSLLHIERGFLGKPDIVALGILSNSSTQRAGIADARASRGSAMAMSVVLALPCQASCVMAVTTI